MPRRFYKKKNFRKKKFYKKRRYNRTPVFKNVVRKNTFSTGIPTRLKMKLHITNTSTLTSGTYNNKTYMLNSLYDPY